MAIDTCVARVHEALGEIEGLMAGGVNFPLEPYVDTISITAMCAALRVPPSEWRADELTSILLIRDGLYDIRNRLRDVGDDAEHSIERLLSVMDRLYADLERTLRELDRDELEDAQNALTALRRGPSIQSSKISSTLSDLKHEANELLAQTNITHNHINISIISIDRSQLNVDLNFAIELLKSAQLNIRRLSANVFAIKLQLEQTVVFHGIYKFLTNGADKVVAELKALAAKVSEAYKSAADFLTDISGLAEKGGRFSRLVADMLARVFGNGEFDSPRRIDFRVQRYLTSSVVLSGADAADSKVVLGGKDGHLWTVDTSSGAVVDQQKVSRAAINCVAPFRSEYERLLALGTEDGLEVIYAVGRASTPYTAPYRENVVAVASPSWGQGAIVTGTRDGTIRRWSLAGRLSQYSTDSSRKVGRTIQQLRTLKEHLLVASGDRVLFVDEELNATLRIPVDFKVRDMFLLNEDTMLACGDGHVAHINLRSGAYSRFLIASSEVKYSSLLSLKTGVFCVGTEDGFIAAIDFNSGEEIGRVDVGFPVRGLLGTDGKVIAYGGDWNRQGRSTAILSWREATELSEVKAKT